MTDEQNAAGREYLDKVPREVQDLVYEGRKIEAIKLAREMKGWGLAQAKEEVERVEAALRARSPESFAAPRAGGCSIRAAGLLAILISVLLASILVTA